MSKKKRVSVIGYGALGKTFIRVLKEKLQKEYTLAGIMTRHESTAKRLASAEGCRHYPSISEMIADEPDFVVEIASAKAVRDYGKAILEAGINLIVVSVGALADDTLFQDLLETARQNGGKLYIASGSIGGFDLMRTISLAGPPEVVIENFKSPNGLVGAPHLNGVEPSSTQEEVVFSGNAREAIAGFPKNVNVAVAASLATAGVDKAKSVIHSVPGATKTVHRLKVKNALATARIEITAKPDPDNPRSSSLTAWSVAALLQNLASPVQYF